MLTNNPGISFRSAVVNLSRIDPLPDAPSAISNVVVIALGADAVPPDPIAFQQEVNGNNVTSERTNAVIGDAVQITWENAESFTDGTYTWGTSGDPLPDDIAVTEQVDAQNRVIEITYTGASQINEVLNISFGGLDTVSIPISFLAPAAQNDVELVYTDKQRLEQVRGTLASGEYEELATMHTFVLLAAVASNSDLQSAIAIVNDAPDMYSCVVMTPAVSQMWAAARIDVQIPLMLSDTGEAMWNLAQMFNVGVMACEAGDGAAVKAVTFMCQDRNGVPQFTNRITDMAIRGVTSNREKRRHREARVSFWMVTNQKTWPMRLTVGGIQLFIRMYQLAIDESIKNAAASIFSEGRTIVEVLDGRLQVAIIAATSQFSQVLEDTPTVLVPSARQITTGDRLSGDVRGVIVNYSVFGEAVELFVEVQEEL